jgi:hypothetical protein
MEWKIQQEHQLTHNLFHSAVFGEEGEGIVDIGFRIVGDFMYIPDNRNNVDVEPPYTVLGDDTVVFFDFVTPGEIKQDDINRVSKYNEIGLEAIENHLKRTPISEDHLDPNDVEWFDHCTILREEQYIDHRSGSAQQRENLRQLENVSSIATITPDGLFSLEERDLRNGPLSDLLNDGISVPRSPPNIVYLTRRVEDESLAVGICEEIVLGGDLSDGGVALDFEAVKSHFGRDIQYERLEDIFSYLRDIGACRKRREDGKFLFTKYKLNQIMGVRDRLENETIEEHLYDGTDESDDGMSDLSDFT